MITIGEGAALWEKFGHNSLWFYDSAARVDEAYNWGVFDFAAPDFAWRFVTGDTKYWVDMYPGGQVIIDWYAKRDRSVDVQRLNFTPAQAAKALAFARNNALEANKFYRYAYFRDNCSTRVRDLIDYATDGAVKSATAAAMTPYSYRSESVRLTDALFFAQLGITTALGRPADAPISKWDAAFIPMRLRDIVRDIRVTVDGKSVPLVAEERTVYTTKEHTELAQVPPMWRVPFIIGLLFAINLLGLGLLGEKYRGVDIAFRSEVAVWSLLTGVLGAAILFAWLFTRHVFWANNETLLVVNPLAVWLVPLAFMSRRPRWARPAAITAVIVALCSAIALVLFGIPGAGQSNAAVLALAVPINFAVAFGLWRRAAVSASSVSSA